MEDKVIKMKIKSLVYITVASMIVSTISVLPVQAVDVDALKAEVKDLQSEKSALQTKLNTVNSKITSYNTDIKKLQKEKAAKGSEIEEIIVLAYEHYEALQIKPLETAEKSEPKENIQRLIGIKNLTNISNQAYNIGQVFGSEKEILNEYWEQKNDAQAKQVVIESEISGITELKDELVNEKTSLSSEIATKNSKITTANNKIYAATYKAETVAATGSGTGKEIANYALNFVGNPYKLGGTSLTSGADCSGFVQSVYAKFGYSLPRTTVYQISSGKSVSYSNAVAGDLIFYSGHVGIYIGSGRIVHSSTDKPYPQGGIKTSSATWDTIIAVRRIVN